MPVISRLMALVCVMRRHHSASHACVVTNTVTHSVPFERHTHRCTTCGAVLLELALPALGLGLDLPAQAQLYR